MPTLGTGGGRQRGGEERALNPAGHGQGWEGTEHWGAGGVTGKGSAGGNWGTRTP